jgi:hypothetical protein
MGVSPESLTTQEATIPDMGPASEWIAPTFAVIPAQAGIQKLA